MSRDRFEASVERELISWRNSERDNRDVDTIILQLLRREHAAIVRDVKRLREVPTIFDQPLVRKQDVLALLAARKGKP